MYVYIYIYMFIHLGTLGSSCIQDLTGYAAAHKAEREPNDWVTRLTGVSEEHSSGGEEGGVWASRGG